MTQNLPVCTNKPADWKRLASLPAKICGEHHPESSRVPAVATELKGRGFARALSLRTPKLSSAASKQGPLLLCNTLTKEIRSRRCESSLSR